MDRELPPPAARLWAARADVAVAGLAGVAGVAGSYAAAGFTPSFVAAPVEGVIARYVPGALVTLAITVLGDLGQRLSLLAALTVSAALLAAFAGAGLLVGRRLNSRAAGPLLAGTAGWLAAALVTGSLVLAVGAGLPVALVLAAAELPWRAAPSAAPSPDRTRRRALTGLVSALSLSAVGVALGRERTPDATTLDRGGPSIDPSTERGRLLASARDRSFDLPGAEPLVSREFYSVDINSVDPTVDAGAWTLSVTGAVEQPAEYDLAALRDRPVEHRFVTLRCVGERLNGRKMDTALWTGTPLRDVVEAAGPTGDCDCVMLHGVDGYSVQFPVAALEDGLLAWGMNDGPLPRAHGYPVRALVPGHWGETNAKWITEMEFLEREADGYWEQKGWQGTGPVETVAKLHSVDRGAGTVQVGGHAYAGTRGVSAVEVSVDGGETWTEAELTDPLPGWGDRERARDAWRGWRHRYDDPGEHTVVVRAVEADGTVQSSEETGRYPSGPSGWVTRRLG